MHNTRVVLVGFLFALSCFGAAQDTQPSRPCLQPHETIYKPGIDGVKPPQLQPDKSKSAVPIHGPMSFELTVNSEGHVCSIKVTAAKDPSSANQVANYIGEHWTFKPATRNGQPVAVL